MPSLVSNLLLAGILAAVPGVLHAASFTPLGDPTGGSFYSQANAISADGSVVVGVGNSAFGFEAFIWDATNGFQGLGDLAGGIFSSQADAVSADGSTVVGLGTSGSGGEAFVWDATNGMQGIGDLPTGGFGSRAFGVSADGSAAVGSGRAGGPEAFIWDATNGLQGLGQLAGGSVATQLFGVSANGSIGVGRATSETGGPLFITEAIIWDAVNGIQGIGDLAGGSVFSEAWAVSGDGSTVVGIGSSASGNEAFIWDATTGFQGLGDLAGGSFSSHARAVSADGSTVVGYGNSAAGEEAFIWDATNGIQSLQALLTTLGLDVTGWQLSRATGISADGTKIVGFGTNPSGFTEAFVAVLVEPAATPVPSLSPIGITTLLGLFGLAVGRWGGS